MALQWLSKKEFNHKLPLTNLMYTNFMFMYKVNLFGWFLGGDTSMLDQGSAIDLSVPDTPPQKKIKLEVMGEDIASPVIKSDISSLSSSDSVEPIELPPFTLTVKCALRDGDCNSTIWNMVSIGIYW